MNIKPKGHTAVMASRCEPPDSLEFFPTPPWATRALMVRVLSLEDYHGKMVWEPAAGEGHMAEVLPEYFSGVIASDVHDYGVDYDVGSFVGEGPDHAEISQRPDWIITNPPFSLAIEFALRALDEARVGVALFIRSNWSEGTGRYKNLFVEHPPTIIAQFCERVPLAKGRWNPDGSTATSYSWFVWRKGGPAQDGTRFVWIPPGQRKSLEHKDDRVRFAYVEPAGLLEAME